MSAREVLITATRAMSSTASRSRSRFLRSRESKNRQKRQIQECHRTDAKAEHLAIGE